MLGRIYSILKLLRFDVLYENIKVFLPEKITTWVDAVSEQQDPLPLVSVKHLKPKFEYACLLLTKKLGAQNIGDYLEFGVRHGTSLYCMFQTLQGLKLEHVRLFGFDSFEGLPPIAAIDIENDFQPGDHASSLADTSQRLTRKGIDWSRTFLIKGWYNDTLNNGVIAGHKIQKASLIMIDCDLYSSAKEALNFCRSLIKDTCIMFFDDWNENKNIGGKRAFNEFLAESPHLKSVLLATYKYNGLPSGRVFLVNDSSVV